MKLINRTDLTKHRDDIERRLMSSHAHRNTFELQIARHHLQSRLQGEPALRAIYVDCPGNTSCANRATLTHIAQRESAPAHVSLSSCRAIVRT